jgi:hypothetical protein
MKNLTSLIAILLSLFLIQFCFAVKETNAAVSQTPTSGVFLASPLSRLLIKYETGVEAFRVEGNQRSFWGLTSLGADILVADNDANIIRRFSSAGKELSQFASVFKPYRIESDRAGNVYANTGSLAPFEITRFNSAGQPTLVIRNSVLVNLGGLDADRFGNIYVTSSGSINSNRALFKFTSDGSLLNVTPLPTFFPSDLAINETTNRLFIVDETSGAVNIQEFDISGEAPILLGGFAIPEVANAAGLAVVEGTGNLLVVDDGRTGSSGWAEYSSTGGLIASHRLATPTVLWDIVANPVPEPSSHLIALIALLIALLLTPRVIKA